MAISPRSTKPPREHLLEVVSDLFYREGINTVGIDQIVRDAGVTRATLYRHFPGKEALVVAYLKRADAKLREQLERVEGQTISPEHLLEAVIEGIADEATGEPLRGCPFINASAEFPDAASPVRQAIAEQRAWFRAFLVRCLENAGRANPGETADALVLLRDGVLVGSYLDDPSRARLAFLRVARSIAGLR
ncbi:TetR/AcrR family transcriptional regulator [Arthrobacter sp. TMN-37]